MRDTPPILGDRISGTRDIVSPFHAARCVDPQRIGLSVRVLALEDADTVEPLRAEPGQRDSEVYPWTGYVHPLLMGHPRRYEYGHGGRLH